MENTIYKNAFFEKAIIVKREPDHDATKFFDFYLKDRFRDVNETGVPEIVKVSFIKTNNNEITEDNFLFEVNLPIIPASYRASKFSKNQPKFRAMQVCDLDFETLEYDFYKKGTPEIAKQRYKTEVKTSSGESNISQISDGRVEILMKYLCEKLQEEINKLANENKTAFLQRRATIISWLKSLSCLKDDKQKQTPSLSGIEKHLVEECFCAIYRYAERLKADSADAKKKEDFEINRAEYLKRKSGAEVMSGALNTSQNIISQNGLE